MAEKDDRDWFEALAGRKAADASPEAAREGQALRDAMLATRQKAEPEPDFDTDSGVQRLLFRLRQEGLLGSTIRKWRTHVSLALAASFALAIGLMVVRPGMEDEEPKFRGGPGAPQVVKVADASRTAEQIVADLKGLGLAPQVTEFGAVVTIVTDWPAQPEPRHREFLKRHGLNEPPAGRLTVEIHPKR